MILSNGNAIPSSVIKAAMPSMLVGVFCYWLARVYWPEELRLGRSGGLLLGIGLLLNAVGYGFGSKLKGWLIAILVGSGAFLFAMGGNATIR